MNNNTFKKKEEEEKTQEKHQRAPFYVRNSPPPCCGCLCLSEEGSHLVSKFWKLAPSWPTLKFVAVEKLNGRRAGFVAAVSFIL